ncbi:hypothetical protein VaNZ11_009156 [Volvox africanus]|uniref:Polycystin cation channel PKD1/PKD2 domain-containing protein n=1 Tax=Volvox africanus TaxID=51714 RepID=A0ABQ5S6N1_9CHLO|nr:hypothetical protein VaNZ11_009156 [Volvox africanus]
MNAQTSYKFNQAAGRTRGFVSPVQLVVVLFLAILCVRAAVQDPKSPSDTPSNDALSGRTGVGHPPPNGNPTAGSEAPPSLVATGNGHPPPDNYSSDYGGDYAAAPATNASNSEQTGVLTNFTSALLKQELGVFGQGMRIPYSLFASHPCQVVYLGNPDWSTLQLQVTFQNTPLSACTAGKGPLAALAYIDGYNTPKSISGVLLSSGRVMWVAAVAKNDGDASAVPPASQPSPGAASPAASPSSSPEPDGSSQGKFGRLRRSLWDFTIGGAAGFQAKKGRETFKSAYEDLRGGAEAARSLLRDLKSAVPGPQGPLTLPVMLSPRQGVSVAAASGYQHGALVKLDYGYAEGTVDPLSNAEVLSEGATSYWAPEGDCLAALSSSSGSSLSTAYSDGNSTTLRDKVGGGFQDSCFATQVVVYIYNPCVNGSFRKAANAAVDPGMAASNGNSGGGGNGSRAQRVLALLEGTLDAQTGDQQLVNHALGYVDVLVTYSSYGKCVREGVDRLYDVSIQVMIFAALLFGWLVVLLLLPSLYRLFLEFPFRMLLHSIRKLQGKDDALKPMRPGLHSHKHRSVTLPRVMAKVAALLLRFRKYLLYAVITVHYSDGQSRWLQVSVISTVALSIAQAVYSPGILPPLEHFVPPLALQITRDGTAMASLQYFFDIVVFSSFMGTLGYLSMLANYNSPVNRYYRLQVILSAFFMALQDFLVLLQLVSLLAQWRYLNPRWPYLPLVVFQLANLTGANLMQVVIFTRRHDQHNRAVYDAYVAAKNARGEAEAAAAVEARTTARGGGGRRRRTGDGSDGAGSKSGPGSSSSAAEENIIIAEILDGGGSTWRQRRSRQETDNACGGGGGGGGGADDYYVNVRRHRERPAPQLETKQPRRRRRKQQDCVEQAEGELEAEEEEAEGGAEHEQQRRQRAQVTRSSKQQNTRRLTWRAEDTNNNENGDDEEEEEDGGGREEGTSSRGYAGRGAVVVTAAVASDASRTDTEQLSPPSDHGSSQRRSSRRQRRATDDAEDKNTRRRGNADTHAPAAAASVTARPRRRLLGDASLGPGPVAEGVENLAEEAANVSGGGGAAATRLLMRRHGSRNDAAVSAERPASSSDISQAGGSSRRLLVPTPDHNATAAAAAAGGADSSSGGGERERNRRLYGGCATAGLDEQNGVSFYKRSFNVNKIAAAAGPDAGGVRGKGSAPKLSAVMTPAATATQMATVVVDGNSGGGDGSYSAPLPGLTKPPLMSQMRDARVAGSWKRIGSRGNVLREEDLHMRIRDVAAAAGTTYKRDSDALDSDRGGSGSSSSSSSDAEGDQGREKHTHGAMRDVLALVLRPFRRLWRGLRESPDFRYPAWLLAALLVSAYMVIFHFGKALAWSSHLADCLEDPANCIASVLGKYFKFVVRLLSVAKQQQLRDVLVRILDRKNDLMEAFAGMLGISNEPNKTITATQLLVLDKQKLLEQATSNADLEAAMSNISATLNQSLSGLASTEEIAAMVSKITANLSSIVISNLNSTVGRLVDATNNKLASAVPGQEAFYRKLNSPVNVLYDAVNTTTRFVSMALDVEGEVRIWRSDLSSRFRWTSVFGFTLGLLLGLSTLLQTAVSFRRAIRRARRLRKARRLFKYLLVSGGVAGTNAAAAAPGAPGAEASLAGKDVLLKGGEESLLVTRARDAKISVVVFFFGVLMSTAVIQLYMVGVLLSVILAVLTHPWTWHYLMPNIWLYIVAIAAVFVLNKFVLIGYVGNAFLSDGDHIYRPAAWLAFIFIMSITNLVIGLLLAVYRIVLLLLTSVLALGKLEVTIFTFFSWLDLAHTSFLAGLHMHESMSNFHDPIYLPGPRGRAHRRWRKLREIVRRLTPEELRLLATLGRPKEVQDCLDHVVVDMKAARKLAAASRSVDAASSSLIAGAPGLGRFAGVEAGPSSVQHTSTSGKMQPSPVVESWGRRSREGHGAGATATVAATAGAGASGIRRPGSEHAPYSIATYGKRRGDGSSKGMVMASGELSRGRVYARLDLGDEDPESGEEGNEKEEEEEEEAHVDLARRRRGGSSRRGKKAQV